MVTLPLNIRPFDGDGGYEYLKGEYINVNTNFIFKIMITVEIPPVSMYPLIVPAV